MAKSWYCFRLPNGAKVEYKGNYIGEALNELKERTGYGAEDVTVIGSSPILPPVSKTDYERIKKGVAIGIAALKGKTE